MESQEAVFGRRVAELANRLKVKQTRIAVDCEISRISVNRFFRGRSEIRASDLVNVLKLLGIDIDQEIQRRLGPGCESIVSLNDRTVTTIPLQAVR